MGKGERVDGIWEGVERRDLVPRRRNGRKRFLERRGGFDRRRRDPLFGRLLDNPAALVALLVALNALSLIDGFYTLAEVGAGVAREANPVLAAAGVQSPLLALGVKLGSLGFVTAIIWLNRRRRAVLAVGVLAVIAYALVVVYHRWSLGTLGML